MEYPKGFLVSYSTSFGNDSPGFTRYMGKKATLTNIGGEGSPRYQLVEEKGNHEDNPNIDQTRGAKYILLPGETKLPPMSIDDRSLGHMANWFESMRSRRQPHSSGKKQYWDAATETILDRVPGSQGASG